VPAASGHDHSFIDPVVLRGGMGVKALT